jgi:hypothetical protein
MLLQTILRGAQIFQKSRKQIKIPGARNGYKSNFHAEESQKSDTSVKHLAATVTWRPRFVHPWA